MPRREGSDRRGRRGIPPLLQRRAHAEPPERTASIVGLTAANVSARISPRGDGIRDLRHEDRLEAFQALASARGKSASPAAARRARSGGNRGKRMNLPVKRPDNDESAAMGGAIQALWCLKNLEAEAAGKPAESIARLTDEHIKINEADCINPDPAAVAAYDKAYAEYSKYLKALSPLYI
jgi:xylulokinase